MPDSSHLRNQKQQQQRKAQKHLARTFPSVKETLKHKKKLLSALTRRFRQIKLVQKSKTKENGLKMRQDDLLRQLSSTGKTITRFKSMQVREIEGSLLHMVLTCLGNSEKILRCMALTFFQSLNKNFPHQSAEKPAKLIQSLKSLALAKVRLVD